MAALNGRSSFHGSTISPSAIRTFSNRSARPQRPQQIQRAPRRQRSIASTRRVFRTTCFSLSADVIPMLTKSSLLPLVVIEPGRCRMRQHAILRHQRRRRHLHHHEARFEAGMLGQKRRQVFVQRRIHQPVDAPLGDAGQRGQRDRQVIELQAPAARRESCRRR